MCVLWLGSRQRLQRFPKHPQNQDMAGTPRSACEENSKEILRTISYKEVVSGQVFLMKQEAPRKSKEEFTYSVIVIVFPGISPSKAKISAINAKYFNFWSIFSLKAIFARTIPAIAAAMNAIRLAKKISQYPHIVLGSVPGPVKARRCSSTPISLTIRPNAIKTKASAENLANDLLFILTIF